MSAILLKNVPPLLYSRLERRALAQGRSVPQEAIRAIECGLNLLEAQQPKQPAAPVPIKVEFPMTNAFMEECKRERDARDEAKFASLFPKRPDQH